MYSPTTIAAVIGAFLLACAVAQESPSDVDAYLAQPDPQGCQLGPETCSCSLQASPGTCTKSLVSEGSPPGVCGQLECSESYKCDCLGFEICKVNKCGQWKPVSPLSNPVPERFSCEYTPNIAECRSWEGFAEDVFGSENAADDSVSSLAESAQAEDEIFSIASEVSKKKIKVVEAMKEINTPKVLQSEKDELDAEVDLFIEAAEMCTADVKEAIDTANEVYKSQKQAKAERKAAKKAAALEKEESDKLAKAKKDNPECPQCAELKAKIKEHRQARRAAAIAAGTWAKKARDGKKKAKAAKKKAAKSKLTAEELEARCIARKTAILAKYEAESKS